MLIDERFVQASEVDFLCNKNILDHRLDNSLRHKAVKKVISHTFVDTRLIF